MVCSTVVSVQLSLHCSRILQSSLCGEYLKNTARDTCNLEKHFLVNLCFREKSGPVLFTVNNTQV